MGALSRRYTLQVPLGESSLGSVWTAIDDERKAQVVVLQFEADAGHERAMVRFREQARKLLGIRHAHVVQALDEGDDPTAVPCLVVERLDGESLASRWASTPLKVERLVEIAVGIADGLSALHAAGVCHGDVEPGNVFLAAGGEGQPEVAKLIGLALNRAPSRARPDGAVDSSSESESARHGYAAPEQLSGEVVDSVSADVYSLAAVVYAALTGAPPGHEGTAALGPGHAGSTSAALHVFETTLARALSADRAKRYPDAKAFARALKACLLMNRAVGSLELPVGKRTPRRAAAAPPAAATAVANEDGLALTSPAQRTDGQGPSAPLEPTDARPITPSAVTIDGSIGTPETDTALVTDAPSTVPVPPGPTEGSPSLQGHDAERSEPSTASAAREPADAAVDAAPPAAETATPDEAVRAVAGMGHAAVATEADSITTTNVAAAVAAAPEETGDRSSEPLGDPSGAQAPATSVADATAAVEPVLTAEPPVAAPTATVEPVLTTEPPGAPRAAARSAPMDAAGPSQAPPPKPVRGAVEAPPDEPNAGAGLLDDVDDGPLPVLPMRSVRPSGPWVAALVVGLVAVAGLSAWSLSGRVEAVPAPDVRTTDVALPDRSAVSSPPTAPPPLARPHDDAPAGLPSGQAHGPVVEGPIATPVATVPAVQPTTEPEAEPDVVVDGTLTPPATPAPAGPAPDPARTSPPTAPPTLGRPQASARPRSRPRPTPFPVRGAQGPVRRRTVITDPGF